MSYRLLSLVIGLALVSGVWAFDSWPQFRGPNRDGISTEKGLLDRWDEAPPLVWKAEGLGNGYSGVSVSGGIACTMGDRNGKNTVICLSDKDGKEIWATVTDNAWKDRKGWPGSRCTPTIDGQRIYAVSPYGTLVCLKTATGERVWEKSYLKDFKAKQFGFGFTESILVDGDKIICSPGHSEAGVLALNKYTGAEIWRCGLKPDRASHSSVVISHGAGIKQYVQVMDMGLIGIHAETGKLLWRYSRGFFDQSNINTPIIRGDYVFIGIGWGYGSALVKLEREGDGIKAREVYFIPSSKVNIWDGGAVLVGDHVYTCHQNNGSPRCLELLTGKMTWENRRGPGRGQAAIVYADGHLYYRYQDGVMALTAANPNEFQMKGMFQIPGARAEGYAHPSISNGRLDTEQKKRAGFDHEDGANGLSIGRARGTARTPNGLDACGVLRGAQQVIRDVARRGHSVIAAGQRTCRKPQPLAGPPPNGMCGLMCYRNRVTSMPSRNSSVSRWQNSIRAWDSSELPTNQSAARAKCSRVDWNSQPSDRCIRVSVAGVLNTASARCHVLGCMDVSTQTIMLFS